VKVLYQRRAKGLIFYVYEHWRLDKDQCFWVGKGHGKRAWTFARTANFHYSGIVRKLTSLGMIVEVRFIAVDLSEQDAFMLETLTIAAWRAAGVPLTNQTNGGEGTSGLVRTEENKRKLSIAHRGKVLSPEHRAKIGLKSLGRHKTAEVRAKIGQKARLFRHTEETKCRISASKQGKTRGYWVNNGTQSTLIKDRSSLLEGWQFGMLSRKRRVK
jgi:hypothetical protein